MQQQQCARPGASRRRVQGLLAIRHRVVHRAEVEVVVLTVEYPAGEGCLPPAITLDYDLRRAASRV